MSLLAILPLVLYCLKLFDNIMNDGEINRAYNYYRDVPYAESVASHMYYTFRRFPELSVSVPESDKILLAGGSSEISLSGMKPMKRKVIFKSTHRLDELCRSSVDNGEFNALRDFKSSLLRSKSALASLPRSHGSQSVELTDPLESANQKLGKLAIKFNAQGVNNDLKGFAGLALSKKEFDRQLKRCLCIWLTSEELDALMLAMDSDGNGAIDGVEFIRYFFDLGIKERDRMRDNRIESISRKAEFEQSVRRKDEER
jgi:hypothetical protein